MNHRSRALLPTLVWLTAVGLSTAFAIVALAGGTSLGDAASALGGITFSTVGLVIASKRRDNRVGWIFLGIGLSLALNGFSFTFADFLRERSDGSAWHWFAWVGTWSWQPGFLLLFPILFLVFPDGHIRWARGGTLLRLSAAGAAAAFLGTVWNPADLPGVTGYRNPIGIESLLDPSDYLLVGGTFLHFASALIAAVLGLKLRFRTSSGPERQQVKWFVFAGFATLLLYVVGSSLYNMGGSELGGIVALFGVPLLPVATAVAILRYRLYEIDRIINRALVYGALSLVLAAAYLLLVVMLQGLMAPLTADSDLAVAGSTLAVAALFRPMRSRTQSLIDRRFYRRRYDASATLDSFSSRLRDQVDLRSLQTELVGVVGETMQPAHASLWLRKGKGG